MVLSTETSPAHCFINYCKEEGDWLLKSLSVVKCPLDDFKLARIQMKSYTNVLQLSFPHYCLEIAFDSFTKMDQWYNTLRPIIGRQRNNVHYSNSQTLALFFSQVWEHVFSTKKNI